MTTTVTEKLSWRLKELPAATGLTEAFWRKQVRLNKIPVRKVGGAIVILDSDLRDFLLGKKRQGNKEETWEGDQSFDAAAPAHAFGD